MEARLRRLGLAAAVVVVAGAAAGGSSAMAGHPRFGVSFRTPQRWTRMNSCWTGAEVLPIALLTTERPAPKCRPSSAGVVSWPQAQRLGANGVSVALSADAVLPGVKERWNARVAGQPAWVARPVYGRKDGAPVACPAGVRREFRAVSIRWPHAMNTTLEVAAVICGPHLAAGEAAFRQVLGSIRFAR